MFAVMSVLIGSVHAASVNFHVTPNSFVINTTNVSLYQENVSILSNTSGKVIAKANSPNVFLPSSFNVTAGTTYHFIFSVNATKTASYLIKFNQSNFTYSLPIKVNFNNVTPSVTDYSINIQGSIAPYSQVVISVMDNGKLAQNGELIVSYNNVTQSESLSTNPFPTISFGNVYGFVKIYYYSSSGSLAAYSIMNAGGTSTSQLQPVALSCPSLQSSQAIANVSIYSIYPDSTINCVLYDPSDYSIVTGANIVAIQNGQLFLPSPGLLSEGELSIAPPAGGWQVGNILMTLKSNQYKLTPTFFSVVKRQNPSYLSFVNGSEITSNSIDTLSFQINPNTELETSIHYPNGTKVQMNLSSPYTISSNKPGTVNVTTYSDGYSPKTFLLTMNSIPIKISANTTNASIYTYTPYVFTAYSNNVKYDFNGAVLIGSDTVSFTNGQAAVILDSANSTIVSPLGYSVSLPQALLPKSVTLEFLENGIPVSSLSAGTIYTVETVDSKGTIVPITANITSTDVNATIPLKAGVGYFSPPSAGIYKLQASPQGVQPFTDTIKVGPALIGGLSDINIVEIAIGVIIVFALISFFTHRKKNKYEYMSGAVQQNNGGMN